MSGNNHQTDEWDTKTMPEWDGQTYNSRPYISENSDETVYCVVETHQGSDEEGNIVYDNDCGWEGPVSDTRRGPSKGGSQPIDLLCPECGRRLAAAKGTTAAGYWGQVLDG